MAELGEKILVVLAHPDDETIISGTLAMLAARDCDIKVIYVTSGDDGPDETGRGLHGEPLADVREQEAQSALEAIGIRQRPLFLRYPDGHVPDHAEDIMYALCDLLREDEPVVVISFGPDGITGDWDHAMTGLATDFAFDRTESGKLLLHMAHTKSLIPIAEAGVDISEDAVDLRVDVTGYTDERVRAFNAHYTQFPKQARVAYKLLVHARRTEEFIVSRNRNADELLHRCFETAAHDE